MTQLGKSSPVLIKTYFTCFGCHTNALKNKLRMSACHWRMRRVEDTEELNTSKYYIVQIQNNGKWKPFAYILWTNILEKFCKCCQDKPMNKSPKSSQHTCAKLTCKIKQVYFKNGFNRSLNTSRRSLTVVESCPKHLKRFSGHSFFFLKEEK